LRQVSKKWNQVVILAFEIMVNKNFFREVQAKLEEVERLRGELNEKIHRVRMGME